jgi:hypothetical protein
MAHHLYVRDRLFDRFYGLPFAHLDDEFHFIYTSFGLLDGHVIHTSHSRDITYDFLYHLLHKK